MSCPPHDLRSRAVRWALIGALAVVSMLATVPAQAAGEWIVVDSRGAPVRSGDRLAAGVILKLPEGARVTLIARSGRAVTLRGVFDGVVPRIEGEQDDPRRALSALIAAREERIRTIGVVRSGEGATRLPDPWLIDISRPGPRCIHDGHPAAFWRPPGSPEAHLTIWPTDRSWRIDLDWPASRNSIEIPAGVRPAEGQTLIAAVGDREHAIAFTLIAASLDEPVLLAAWMIEKGCIQQADALLDRLAERPGNVGSPAQR